jgi:hypothetical protein
MGKAKEIKLARNAVSKLFSSVKTRVIKLGGRDEPTRTAIFSIPDKLKKLLIIMPKIKPQIVFKIMVRPANLISLKFRLN